MHSKMEVSKMRKVIIISGILLMVYSLSTWKVSASEIRVDTTTTTTSTTPVTTCPVPGYYYFDEDEDGYGDPNRSPVFGCWPHPGLASNNLDCDDTDSDINPGAPEVPCDSKDNNCNGQIDEVLGTYAYYGDEDGDGYGNPNFHLDFACPPPPPGWVDNNLDCDDTDPEIHAGALELCDGVDNNCNDLVDEGCVCQCPADSSLGCIFGTMYYVPNGLAVPGVTVKLKRLFPRPKVEMEVATDDDGCYRFTDLEEGIYKIKVKDCKGSSGIIVIADGRKAKKDLGWWHNRRLTRCFYRVED